MAVKANWQNGEQFNASDQNAVADAVNAAYVKPTGGVPITDLTASVQVSLGKADTAVQSVNAASITDSTTTGRAVITAVDAAAARTTLGVSYGTTAGTVVQGNDSRLSPSSTSITDSTATGRSLITAADPAAARTAIGVAYGSTGGTVAQGNDSRIVGAEQTANKGVANGYASLDSGGKVPVSQLPSSIMEYQGTYNASTNSPSLVNGTGNTGDVYRVSVAGTRNFGAGNISFEVGDYVIYSSGGLWEKSDTTDAVSTVAGLTGDVTASSLLGALGSGTPSSTTFLRGDGSWQPAGSVSYSTITTPTVLAAAPGTDYVYFVSGVTTAGTPTAAATNDPNWGTTVALLHGNGANNSTTITDNSALSANWTANGNVKISTAQSKFGGASILFDGANTSFLTPTADVSNYAFTFDGTGQDFTIEMWLYPTAFNGSSRVIYDARPTGTQGAYPTIYCDSNGTLCYYRTGANQIIGPMLGLNTWTHIAVCKSGYMTRLFVNGVQYGVTHIDVASYLSATAGRPRIGMTGFDASNGPWSGYMDDIRISRYARYTANFTVPVSAFPDSGSVVYSDGIVRTPANPTLPTAVNNANVYSIKNIFSADVTVNTTGSQLIEGASSFVIGVGQSIDFRSDGSQWRIV